MMATFYTFRNNTSSFPIYTWAASIVPRSPLTTVQCLACGYKDTFTSGAFDVICEGGSKYPDVLGCGKYPYLLLSEKAISTWEKAGITQYHTYPVHVDSIKSRKLTKEMAPLYQRVEIIGKCRIDLVGSSRDVESTCAVCGRSKFVRFDLTSTFKMIPGSWDGSSLFRDEIQFPCVTFCTREILDIAQSNDLTNFRFEPMHEPPNISSKGINYMKGER